MSVNASTASRAATLSDAIGDEGRGGGARRDPPAARSVASGESIPAGAGEDRRRTESADPPSRRAFSDDEAESVERNPDWENEGSANSSVVVYDKGGGVSVIVDDDDDSFTDGKVSPDNELLTEDGRTGNKEFANNEDEGNLAKGTLAIVDDGDNDPYSPLLSNSESENGSVRHDMDARPSASYSTDGGEGWEEKEYLNISNDGELIVMKGSPKPETPKSPRSPAPPSHDSYFDVHKAEYKELKKKLEEHSRLVEYVERWMETVSTRVQARYFEYGKHRAGLNHYASKFDSLLSEEERLRARNRQMKPKQAEKLERNRVKLAGAHETHDNAGESLLMLMDEAVRRSWRDAFPLLRKSIGFECDFAGIASAHMAKLGRSLELLDVIGDRESIAADGRLDEIRSMNPEDIYTGAKGVNIY